MSNYISPQKKQECIDYALGHPEISTAQLATDFGVGHSTLCGWLKRAREQGVQVVMYQQGLGVAKDETRAHMWTNLAAAQGDKPAAKTRDLYAQQMTQQQIAEAQNLAKKCLARNYKNCDR